MEVGILVEFFCFFGLFFGKIISAKRPIPDVCEADYKQGSVYEPCGICTICLKTEVDNPSLSTCTIIDTPMKRAISKMNSLKAVIHPQSAKYCTPRDFCNEKEIDCGCKVNQTLTKNQEECVNLFGTCKCVCDEKHFGQKCEFEVPNTVSINSFADIQNVVYSPYVLVNDFATLSLYFYETGINFEVIIETQRELLSFNSTSCESNALRIEELCDRIFEDNGAYKFKKACYGGPTHENNRDKPTCNINVNLAFGMNQLRSDNHNYFIFDYPYENSSRIEKNIVAKIEPITLTVKNSIASSSSNPIFSNTYGLVVIYSGRYAFEKCLPLVTIPKFSKSMTQAPKFPRSLTISVTNLISLQDTLECRNLGKPNVNWYVWLVDTNHDEKKNTALLVSLAKDTQLFEPFSLTYGTYKVKTEVKFTNRQFNRGIDYCYFKTVPIPLQPMIIGGSLRYIYYKSNLKLLTKNFTNPNFPENQQPKPEITWYCDDSTLSVCEKQYTDQTSITKYAPFVPGKSYNFTMEIFDSSANYVVAVNQIIVAQPNPIPNLMIECLKNCGGKDFKSDYKEIFYFQVFISEFSIENSTENVYEWQFSEEGQNFQDISSIRQEETTPSYILIVNENSLVQNKRYTFQVLSSGQFSGKAEIMVHISEDSDTFSCEIDPKFGVAGSTKFSLNCSDTKFKINDLSVMFYFYDRSGIEDTVGRLLGTTYIQSIENIVLTRGTVAVLATNMFGQFFETNVSVELTYETITADAMKKSIDLIQLDSHQGYEQKISSISSLCDILNESPHLKNEVIETFLKIINKGGVSDLVELEFALSATKSVLCNKEDCKTKLSNIGYGHLNQIVTTLSKKLINEINTQKKSDVSYIKTESLFTGLIHCYGVLLSIRHNEMLFDDDVEEIDFKIYDMFKFGNLGGIKSLEKLHEALAMMNLPFVKHSAVQTDHISTWMKTDSPKYFTEGTKGKYEGSYISLSKQLAKHISTETDHLTVRTVLFKENPFWFSQAETPSTEVVSVSIGYFTTTHKYIPLTNLKYPIDIFLKKTKSATLNMAGNVKQPNPKDGPDVNDYIIDVHRLYPKKGENILIKFLDLEENDSFKVLIGINLRPDYDQLSLRGFLITKSNSLYSFRKAVVRKEDMVYIGIMPGNTVAEGNIIRYRYELESARCQIWYDYLWASDGCRLGQNSSEEMLHCKCDHLSSIGGFLSVPVNSIDPFQDYKLFLTIPDNPYVFSFISVILLIFLILLAWSIKKDRTDVFKKNILILEDNISTDSFGYLITTITGSKFYAGTTSNIGIILHGGNASSRSHILSSSLRRTLQRNNDDWFLIFTPKHLGILSSIQLWSDHIGTDPNWFCDTIHVHDLTWKKDYTFIVGKWFGVTKLGVRFESFSRPVKFDKEIHFTEFIITNAISGFRECHLWVSVIGHHPRSSITRSMRLSLAMVAFISILLTSILFYDVGLPEEEDLPDYNVSLREVVISIYSVIIAAAITNCVQLVFKKSLNLKNYEQKSDKVHGNFKMSKLIVDSTSALKTSKNSQRTITFYAKKAILSMKQRHFYPVQVQRTSMTNNRVFCNIKIIFAWVFCLSAILIASFFIIWIGLKLGKVKSLMWLTSIGMSFGEDFFLVDPTKIIFTALLFGLVQTQLCDLFSYDPNIYKLRTNTNVKRNLNRDNFLHRLRLQTVYKHISMDTQDILKVQFGKVKQWWVLIDTIDIVFSICVMFMLTLAATKGYYRNNTSIHKFLFKNMHSHKNLIQSQEIFNVHSYSQYLQNNILPSIYQTRWYNKAPLTSKTEIFPETGWFSTLTNRLIGVPRLRQIRVIKQNCTIPRVLTHFSFHCNILFSRSTEDIDDYGKQWKGFTWNGVLFEASPWIYTSPDKSSSVSMFSESRKLFHGGGYIVQLKSSRRESSSTVLNLIDASWIDLRTRIIFLEMTAYNVNNDFFSSIVFIAEHLESTLVLSGGNIWSIKIKEENILVEVLFFLYAVLCLLKIIILTNIVGANLFFQGFWKVYDYCFVVTGILCFIVYQFLSYSAFSYIHEFQIGEIENFFHFQTLLFYLYIKLFLLSLLMVMAVLRTLRLTKYGTRTFFIKLKFTLFSSWQTILVIFSVVISFLFCFQWIISFLINKMYPLNYSHLLPHKMDYPSLHKSAVSQENKYFIYIPCLISSMAVIGLITIVNHNFVMAGAICKRF